MSALTGHVEDYLGTRRALGFELTFAGHVLPQFVAHVEAAGSDTVTVALAVEWAGLRADVAPISRSHRLGAVRGFARYLATIDPATEVPPTGVWPSVAARPTPYLWSTHEIEALLDASRQLPQPLHAATHEALFGLLAACGLRIGEALGLTRNDVDLRQGLITIRDAKLGRSRLVPLHPSTTDALRGYATRRDRLGPQPRPTTFFVSNRGTALAYPPTRKTFIDLTASIGVRTDSVRPRMHDLRHSFAVRTPSSTGTAPASTSRPA